MKKSFWELLNRYRSFLIPYSIFVFLGVLLHFLVSKTDLFLLINKYYSPFWDGFFRAYTWLGDGITVIGICFALLFVKYRYSVLSTAAYLYTSVAAQILKRIFHSPRPSKFFEVIFPIRKIEGYPLYEWNSFPSGHSTSAFTLAVILVYILPRKHWGWIVLLFVLPVAFSRVYLAQHFFEDVLAGSVLGTVLSLQLIYLFERTHWYHSPKLKGRLFGKSKRT